MKGLHRINPLRLDYIRKRAQMNGSEILDIGCGGGILAEAMAAAGGRVTGIDMASSALDAARAHMKKTGVKIDYHLVTAETLAWESPGRFDIVTCMELLEHVPDPASVISACAVLAKPGGDIFISTINRTWEARLLVIFAAERLLGIVPEGTHQYRKLIPPRQLSKWASAAGLTVKDLSGFIYLPVINRSYMWRITRMNYLMHLKRVN